MPVGPTRGILLSGAGRQCSTTKATCHPAGRPAAGFQARCSCSRRARLQPTLGELSVTCASTLLSLPPGLGQAVHLCGKVGQHEWGPLENNTFASRLLHLQPTKLLASSRAKLL